MMIELEACMAAQSWVNREYRRGLSTHPCGSLVLRISEVEMLLPTFTTWGRPVRKAKAQLHRAGLKPKASSLMMSLEGTMSRWDSAVCSVLAIASSVDLLGRYAN